MSYSNLLERMQRNDTEAFLEMTDRYGWAVYSAIREKYADQAEADRIYNETMNAFYHSLANSSAEDPLEALLCLFADYVSADSLDSVSSAAPVEQKPPRIQLCDSVQPAEDTAKTGRSKRGIWYGLGVFLVLMAIAAVLWSIAGLLMCLNYIPFYDLGYSWFNTNVVQLF